MAKTNALTSLIENFAMLRVQNPVRGQNFGVILGIFICKLVYFLNQWHVNLGYFMSY